MIRACVAVADVRVSSARTVALRSTSRRLTSSVPSAWSCAPIGARSPRLPRVERRERELLPCLEVADQVLGRPRAAAETRQLEGGRIDRCEQRVRALAVLTNDADRVELGGHVVGHAQSLRLSAPGLGREQLGHEDLREQRNVLVVVSPVAHDDVGVGVRTDGQHAPAAIVDPANDVGIEP